MLKIQLTFVLLACISADITIRKSARCECSAFIKAECDKWYDCKWSETSCDAKDCSDYTTEDKCTKDCKWKGGKCADGAKECEDMPTEESCSNFAGCGWKDNKCSDFSECSDYTVSKAERCNVIVGDDGEKCQPKGVAVTTTKLHKHLVTAAAGVQCEDKVYLDCSKFTTEATCKGDATATATCQWKSDGKCYAFSLKTCRDADGFNNLCDPKFCKKEGQQCVNRSCTDLATQALCTTLPRIDSNKFTLCKWGADNKCATATDVAFLTEQTCNDVTFGSYHWATTVCQQCQSGWMLSTLMVLFAIVLI